MQNMPLMYHQNRLQCFCFRYQTPTISVLKPKCSQDCKVSPLFTQVRFCCRLVRVQNLGWFAKRISQTYFFPTFQLVSAFFLSRTHVTPFFSLKMIEAEGSQTFRWSPTKASKKSSKQPGRNCHSQQQLKPIYESEFSSEYSTLSDTYRGPTLENGGREGSCNRKKWRHGPDSLSGPDSTSETTHLIMSYSGSVVLSSELVGTDVMVLSVMKPQPGATVFEAGNMDENQNPCGGFGRNETGSNIKVTNGCLESTLKFSRKAKMIRWTSHSPKDVWVSTTKASIVFRSKPHKFQFMSSDHQNHSITPRLLLCSGFPPNEVWHEVSRDQSVQKPWQRWPNMAGTQPAWSWFFR